MSRKDNQDYLQIQWIQRKYRPGKYRQVCLPSLITYFSGMTTVLTWKGIVLPLLITMSIGIAFGLYPAIHAVRVDPIVALPHE